MLTNIMKTRGGRFVGVPPEMEIGFTICMQQMTTKYRLAALPI